MRQRQSHYLTCVDLWQRRFGQKVAKIAKGNSTTSTSGCRSRMLVVRTTLRAFMTEICGQQIATRKKAATRRRTPNRNGAALVPAYSGSGLRAFQVGDHLLELAGGFGRGEEAGFRQGTA